MSKKQKTLFESWNKNTPVHGTANNNTHFTNRNVNSPLQISNFSASLHQSTSSPFQVQRFSKKPDELADPEFDYEAGKSWIYPTNYPLRDYQFSITQEALYKNTLVVLPTGLGKTFIAAVVMYNIYRWFPNGKVVFMAPTRPLVAQQVNACFNITGISEEDTTQMTGTNTPELRKRMWQRKRVFFLTPQVLVNDLVSNICPASSIKCLVIDEAHKALGNHAYCQVIRELLSYTSHFRVLALTATPGSETQAVKQVLTNLLISHVELRSEDSEDVKQYTHIRDIEKIVVPLGVRLNNLKNRFLDVINVYLKRLILRKVMPFKNPASLSKFQVFNYRQEFSKHPPANIDNVTYGLAMADFSLCISLYHAYELLLLHGTTSFYNYLSGVLNGDKSIPHARSELLKNYEFTEIMQNVKETYIPDLTDQNTVANGQHDRRVLPSHPKLDKLLEVVLQHFERAKTTNITNTRVIIFTQYRDSVQEIVTKLSQYQPTVKVTSFIGQSSRSSTSAGYSQKQQLEVIQKFRSGGYNTLVSTCVGEEGLDIGEVDLIVCFDCPKSPIRLVQRIGRTGRLRNGRIILLVTEGKEEQMFNACEYRKKIVFRAMTKGFSFAQFYQNNPSLIPPGVKPICVKTAVTVKPKKLVVKGAPKSPYLTDEEMMEFNQHVRVPEINGPLLPKQELVILKNHAQETARDEGSSTQPANPQLSLSDWTLWQTTPQRTDMIPHSSKSLLLVKILELIHFPELLPSNMYNDTDFANFLDKSVNTSKAHDLHARSVLKQSKITEVLSASKVALEDKEIETVLLSEEEAWEETIPKLKLDNSSKSLPLIQQLFNITVPKCLKNVDYNLKSPPSTVLILSTEEFSHACIKSCVAVENKSTSILRILNKKMKAKLKRKSKELGRNVFCRDSQKIITPEKIGPVSPKSMSEEKNPLPNISFDILHKTDVKQHQNDQNEPDGILFDIDFDLPDPFEDDLLLGNDVSDVNTLTDSHSKGKHAALHDNEKKTDPNFYLDKTSDFNVSPVSLNRDEHTVLKNSRGIDVASFDVDFQDNRENLLLQVSSNKNPVKNTTEKININLSKKSLPEFSKNCNFNISNSNNIVLDSSKSPAQYLGSEISEVTRTNKCDSLEHVNLNLCNVDNFKNSLSKSNYSITNTSFNIPSNNFKKKKLLSKETVLNECNNKISSATAHKNLSNLEQSGLSSGGKSNETTEIYNHSYIDKIENEPNEFSFCFDISFDDKDNKDESNTASNTHDISSETTKVYSVSKYIKDGLEEFDKDANTILKQLLTSQKNVSTDVNTSFSSSLTVKRCISETDKNENSSNRKKLCKTSVSSNSLLKSSCQKANNDKFSDSVTFKVPNISSHLKSAELKSPKDNFDKIANLTDASQYTLTQLLSLIDCTGKVEKNDEGKSSTNKTNNKQDNYETFDISSDDEVCPTPPKEIVKPKSKFIYSKQSAAKKSLHFARHSSFPGNAAGAQNKIPSPVYEFRSQKVVQETSVSQEVKETIKFDNFTQERVEKLRSDTLKDSLITLEGEMDENKIVDLDLSPKITFDLSFDLPFTQNDFESSKDQVFDMNNAIIVESSSSEGKLKSDPSSDCDKLLDERPSDQVHISLKSPAKEDLYLSDDLAEDSESLLPSIPIDNGTVKLSKNIESNSESTCIKSLNTVQGLSEQILKSTNVKEQFNATAVQSHENCAVETTKIQGNLPSKKDKIDDFENSIFFKLLSDDYTSPNDPNSVSTHFKFSDNHEEQCKTDFKTGKESVLLCENENFVGLKETGLNSNLSNFVTHRDFNNKSKSKNDENREKDSLNSKCSENQFSDPVIIPELQPEDIIVKKVCRSNTNSDYHNSMTFSEDKLCFDLNFDDDKTCDILPKSNPGISENVCRISGKQSDLQKREENFKQRCVKNSLSFEESSPPRLFTTAERKEGLKSVTKKFMFKKPETTDIMPDKSLGKLSTSNDEIMLEFDLLDEDQNFMLELKEDKPSVLRVEQEPTVSVDDNNSSDEFDLQNLNQISMFKKPNQVCSKLALPKHSKSFDQSSSTGEREKGKDQSGALKNKCSSKLSIKSNKSSRTVINGNSVSDDEEEDFLFIQKIHKRIDKPSKSGSRKKKHLSNKNEFLLSQAEVSGSDNSDHESACNEDEDALDESFIDDESSPKFDSTDQHAFYLKSIKNCAGLPQKFKMKYTKGTAMFPEHDEENSVYQRDSFCVSDDDVAFLSSDDNEEYSQEVTYRKKDKRARDKNAKKKLKRVVTHDSTSSADDEISPKIRRVNKEISHITSMPNNTDNSSFVAVRKKKHKPVIISSDEENEVVFNHPTRTESHENHVRNVLHHTDNFNSKNKSTTAALSSANDKLEFSIDFDDDDFLTLNDINKIESKISTTLANPPKKKGVNNNFLASVSNVSNNYPTTSKAVDCRSRSAASSNVSSKVAINLSDHSHMKTNSTDAKVAKCDKDEDFEILVIKSSKPSNAKTVNINGPSDSKSSNNFKSASKPIENDNFKSKIINSIETIDLDNEIPEISFNIGWDENCPVSNIIEDPSMNAAKEEKITPEAGNKDKNETDSIILVDSRELASGKPVISALRNIHKVNPIVMQLQSADYILSNRLAAERIFDSEFNSCPLPPKFVEKIKEMDSIYEKSVVIIEKDNRKNSLSFNKDVTKYLKFVVYLNYHPSIQVLFSKSAEHTSELIASLIQQERRKGLHINVPVVLSAKRKMLYNFYSSFPKISPICALNFMYNFPTVEMFLKSSVKDLEKKGCISSHKALSIFNFFQSKLTFHENM